MDDPKHNIKCIDKYLLKFFKYIQSGHRPDDPIPLATVQTFRDASWSDIFLDQDEIHNVFTSYEKPDGDEYEINRGHHINFALAILYAQYCSSHPKTKHPSNWTADEF